MKILLADGLPQAHIETLQAQGHSVSSQPDLDEHTLTDAVTDHDILVVRSTRVTAATLDAAPVLKLVVRAGAGTNTIDKEHAGALNIAVANVPGANALAVAELAIGLIIAIDRHIADNVSDARNQIWNKKKYSKARGLHGQNIGIIGVGAIGFALAVRAKAFGMNVFAVERTGRSAESLTKISDAGIELLETREQLLQTCDIVSLHLPYSEQTRNMVNAEFLAQMKDGAILINTSRGELVDESALLAAMEQKGIRAGLDVYQNEPGAGDEKFNSELAAHAQVVATHHIGASTEQAQTAVADGVLQVIASLEQGNLINKVN